MAEPSAKGIENSSPGESETGLMVPHLVQDAIQTPFWPPSASGSANPRIAPISNAVNHFI